MYLCDLKKLTKLAEDFSQLWHPDVMILKIKQSDESISIDHSSTDLITLQRWNLCSYFLICFIYFFSLCSTNTTWLNGEKWLYMRPKFVLSVTFQTLLMFNLRQVCQQIKLNHQNVCDAFKLHKKKQIHLNVSHAVCRCYCNIRRNLKCAILASLSNYRLLTWGIKPVKRASRHQFEALCLFLAATHYIFRL